jgi:hypothetical protein
MNLKLRIGAWPRRNHAIFAALPLLMALGACSTQITGSEKLANADPDLWHARRAALPVEIHGALPGHTATELAALYPLPTRSTLYASLGNDPIGAPAQRVVIYVNAGNVLPNRDLCQHQNDVTPTVPASPAKVTAALCDGTSAITVARADVRSDKSMGDFKGGLEAVQDQLFQSLYPYSVLTAGVPNPG